METSCYSIGANLGVFAIAYYSHFVPFVLIFCIAFFVLIKSRYSFLSKIFFGFSAFVNLWLLGDLALWVPGSNYNLVPFIWSFMDYVNILFYTWGLYFVLVLCLGRDISLRARILLLSASLPAWYLTITRQSILHFNQVWCEAENNLFLTEYKFGIEILIVLFIIVFSIVHFRKSDKIKKKQIALVSSAMVLFLSVFSVTEYISSQTGIYEINLYSLFILPLFLLMMTYAITNLEIFRVRYLGSQLLAYTLVIMVGSQFFFIEDTVNKALTSVTFVLSLGFAFLLIRSSRREIEAREMVEKQKAALEIANNNQSDLLHFVSHQVKGFLTNTKAALSMVLEGDYGPVTKPVHDIIEQTFISEDRGVTMVQSFLNAARIDDGAVEYTMKEFDLKKLVEDVVRGEENPIKEKGLTLTFSSVPDSIYTMKGDAIKFREVIFNLIDNAIKYTPKGAIEARLERFGNTLRFSVKDNGVGIPEYDQEKIFTKYGHGRDSKKVNVHSNGLGLYLVKNVVEKHSGKAWFTSETEGENKGTTFFVEVPGV